MFVENPTEEDATIIAVEDTSAADHVNVDDVCMTHKNTKTKETQTSKFFQNVYDKSSYDINYASKILQKCDINLGEASKALAETKAKLQVYRNDFDSFKCKACETAKKYGIDTHFQDKRQRKVKKQLTINC